VCQDAFRCSIANPERARKSDCPSLHVGLGWVQPDGLVIPVAPGLAGASTAGQVPTTYIAPPRCAPGYSPMLWKLPVKARSF
jgi:hypothetical protein